MTYIEMCTRCDQRLGAPQVCPGDGRYHHHGRVHTKPGGFEWLCNTCIIEVWLEWNPSLPREQCPAAFGGN